MLFVLGIPCTAGVLHADDAPSAAAVSSKGKLPLLQSSIHHAVKARRAGPDALHTGYALGLQLATGEYLAPGQMPLTVVHQGDTRSGRSPPRS
jgi:hypothetical protein